MYKRTGSRGDLNYYWRETWSKIWDNFRVKINFKQKIARNWDVWDWNKSRTRILNAIGQRGRVRSKKLSINWLLFLFESIVTIQNKYFVPVGHVPAASVTYVRNCLKNNIGKKISQVRLQTCTQRVPYNKP